MLLQESVSLQWILLLGSAGMLIMCFGIVTFIFMYQKKHLANRLQVSGLETKHKEELLQATIIKVEEERKRIARDMHDEIGLQFTLLSQKIEQYKSAPEVLSKEKLFEEIRNIADNGLKSTRRIAYEIMPPEIETIGIVAALENFCMQVNKTAAVQVNFNSGKVEEEPDSKVSIALFRITQELMSNTLKYAGARKIDIALGMDDIRLKYTYHDDGIGFDMHALPTNGGLGFRSVENRVKMIQGDWSIKSSPGNGIFVVIEILHVKYGSHY